MGTRLHLLGHYLTPRRTIHGMVYNALRLFMEINPELFDESMRQYRQKKIEYVLSP